MLAHIGHPSDDGFLVVEAWRSEDTFRRFQDEILKSAIAATGLDAGEPEIMPLWSLARP